MKETLPIQYNELNTLVKKSARSDKREYLEECSNPVMDKDGRLLTNEDEQEQSWTEHFNETLNRPNAQHPADIQLAERHLDIETSPPKKATIKPAIATVRNNNTPGTYSLCAEVFKTDRETATEILHPLFVEYWEIKKKCLMSGHTGG